MNKKVVLSLKNICKDYKQGRTIIEVLKDINLELYDGETLAVIGASGSGKSTLLHIAGLLDYPDKGSVHIAGIPDDITVNLRKSYNIRLEKIGFIYQYHHLLHDFTAQENAAIPLLIKGEKKSCAMDKAEELLSDLGLGKRLCNLPGELSGGERQRVAIARALINDPLIILADEPTGNLDPNTANEVFSMFLERAKKKGTSIITVTHNTELAAKMHRVYKL